MAKKLICRWIWSEPDESWDGACGIKWVFTTDDGPSQHGMTYCPRCGRILIAVRRK